MRCAGCNHEIEVGDRFISAAPGEFMGRPADGLDGLMSELLGGADGEDGGLWKLETYYGVDL